MEAQEDAAAMQEVMQLLEATPGTAPPTRLTDLVTPGGDIPAKREQLAIRLDRQDQGGHRRAAHPRAGQAPD